MSVKFSTFRAETFIAAVFIVLVIGIVAYSNIAPTGYLLSGVKTPAHPTIISYLGAEPKIDGTVTAADRWGDAGVATMSFENGNLRIAAKHDYKYIYFLLQWNDDSASWRNSVRFYFEQDGLTHNHDLDGTNDYFFATSTSAANERDYGGTWNGMYNSWESIGTEFEAAGSNTNQKWTLEVKHPFKNMVLINRAISISQKPMSIGFAAINWRDGIAGGGITKNSWSWPFDEKQNSRIGEYTFYDDAATWGNLDIVWERKPVSK